MKNRMSLKFTMTHRGIPLNARRLEVVSFIALSVERSEAALAVFGVRSIQI